MTTVMPGRWPGVAAATRRNGKKGKSGMSDDDGFVEETWTFAGFRTDRAGKARFHEWYPEGVTEDGPHSLTYKAGQSVPVVGGLYRLLVNRTGERVTARLGDKAYVELNADADLLAYVGALHRTNDARYRAAGIERSDKRRDPLEEALAPVLAVARRLPLGDRDAFALYVLRKIRSAYSSE